MKVVKLACFVVAVGFILQSNLYNTHANPLIPIAKFIGEYLLGKGLDYIWDKRTGKPDVTELQRRIKDLEDVVIQTDPKLADPFKKLFIRINPDTSKEDFQRMAQEVHKDFMRRVADLEGRVDKMERSTEKTDKKIASLSEGLAKLSERLAKLESYPKGDPPTRVPFSAPAAPQPISPIPSLTWERTFGSLQGDTAQAVAVTRDGGYIVAGTTQSKGAGKSDAWLLKLDALGQLEWERTFG